MQSAEYTRHLYQVRSDVTKADSLRSHGSEKMGLFLSIARIDVFVKSIGRKNLMYRNRCAAGMGHYFAPVLLRFKLFGIGNIGHHGQHDDENQ